MICQGSKYRFSSPIDFTIWREKLQVLYKNLVIVGESENMIVLMLCIFENEIFLILLIKVFYFIATI